MSVGLSGDGDQSAGHGGGIEREVAMTSSWLVSEGKVRGSQSNIIEDSLVKSFSGDLTGQNTVLLPHSCPSLLPCIPRI